jgi:RNA polymerase sigma-70 factor (ECF subfamily)
VDQDECLLVERAKVDADSFGALYDRYVDEIHRYLTVRLDNAAAAEDVTAEVFLQALRHIGRYEDRGRPFSSWLYRIAHNAAADYYRRQHVHQELEQEMLDESPSVETLALGKLVTKEIWREVAQLPRQQRIAITLRFREDLSDREAGARMGKSQDAVKQLIFRGMARLRGQLQQAPEGPAPSIRVAI